MDAYENVTALLVPTRAFRIPENTPNLSERRGSGRGIDLIDINREWPGNEDGAFDPRSVYRLWNRLFLRASFQ
jgi:hypothetical protein